MDVIEACMLSVGDRFYFDRDLQEYEMIGWQHNIAMPIVCPVGRKDDYRFVYPFRKVFVESFYKPLKN